MSKPTRTPRNRNPTTGRRRRSVTTAVLGLALIAIATLGIAWWHLASPRPEFKNLVGRWVRPDGGYQLAIADVDRDGALDAAYFNPRPINVARAIASRAGTDTTVFVELRDVNYPGCTYNLRYDPATDTLQGIYYQAALNQQFEIYFKRLH